MKDINKFHRSAMDFADRAFIAKQEGKQRSFITLSRKAFHAEKKAAELCQGQYAIEPTRSILHRSAAALALDCGELREAERLIAMALAGEPPQQIAEELRDLLASAADSQMDEQFARASQGLHRAVRGWRKHRAYRGL